jgi:hypothetical protein
MDFLKFKTAVGRQFSAMCRHELFCADVDPDALWNTYLDSFPAGTNEIFRERRAHDCSACRAFIRKLGGVVVIIDGQTVTIWDQPTDDPAYDVVSRKLGNLVRQHPIANRFLTTERTAGVDKNYEQVNDGSGTLDCMYVREWQHFFAHIPAAYVKRSQDIGPARAEAKASHDVLLRSLTELKDDAVDTVLELIAQGSLYRGDEHKHSLTEFRQLKKQLGATKFGEGDRFVWSRLKGIGGAVARIRNTSIGTLLIDLSGGMDLEAAVRRYEAVMAPTNYKRPTALVTQAMVDRARKEVEGLGLTSALRRRHANMDDLSVSDLLFVDRNLTPLKSEGDDIFGGVASKTSGSKAFSKVETIPVDKFLTEVLPTARALEVWFEVKQAGNLVSLITATDPTAPHLFKWDNPFSWAYNGDLADSIRERVKKAGGSVEGDLCCRLAWYSYDDLDFHMVEPHHHIYYANKRCLSPNGGMLDIDMNAGHGHTREPVENIFYASRQHMKPGTYTLFVHQFCKRDHTGEPGFEVEIDAMGELHLFAYPQDVTQGKQIIIAEIDYDGRAFAVRPKLPSTSMTKTLWNVQTNNFHRVRAMMLSPNHWAGQGAGNKHYFFFLAGCKNDGPARGFFNEFLRSDLDAHRKTLEIIGGKMRAEESAAQLSGLGFSSTKRAELLVRVTSNFTRVLKVEV